MRQLANDVPVTFYVGCTKTRGVVQTAIGQKLLFRRQSEKTEKVGFFGFSLPPCKFVVTPLGPKSTFLS